MTIPQNTEQYPGLQEKKATVITNRENDQFSAIFGQKIQVKLAFLYQKVG